MIMSECIDTNKIDQIKRDKGVEKKLKIWEDVIECSKKVIYGSSFINIKKGKEGILQLCLMTELNIKGYTVRKECPISPTYMDSLGNNYEVGDRTNLSPDISIVNPVNFIIECKHGVCPEAMYQLKVYLHHKKDVKMGCTIEWNVEKDDGIAIYSTLLIKGKSDKGDEKYICMKRKIMVEKNRNDDIIEIKE